jgi:hypothetical protein
MYLAAYTQRLDSTGLTFFDDDVIHFFWPHAKDKSAILLLAIGKPMKESRLRRLVKDVGEIDVQGANHPPDQRAEHASRHHIHRRRQLRACGYGRR